MDTAYNGADSHESAWTRGLSRLDFAFGSIFSFIALVLVFGAPRFIIGLETVLNIREPWYLMLSVCVVVVTVYLTLRWIDFGLRRVVVVHYRLVARDPEVVWGMVYGYLAEKEVPFEWTPHSPIFTGRQERRLSLDAEEGPGIDIVFKAPKLRRIEVMTVIELECPRKGAEAIAEVKRLVDEALVATRRLDGKVVEAVSKPRLVLYGYDDALNKR